MSLEKQFSTEHAVRKGGGMVAQGGDSGKTIWMQSVEGTGTHITEKRSQPLEIRH